jgi:hypothetical protein
MDKAHLIFFFTSQELGKVDETEGNFGWKWVGIVDEKAHDNKW